LRAALRDEPLPRLEDLPFALLADFLLLLEVFRAAILNFGF
jgi:hypothetical protein